MDNNSICLELRTDYNKIIDTCKPAEKLGYNGFFYGESFEDIHSDCYTLPTNLSALRTRILNNENFLIRAARNMNLGSLH